MRLIARVLFWPMLLVCAAFLPVVGVLRLLLWGATGIADRLMPLVDWLARKADGRTHGVGE